jgi:predicted MFS family arabinose efflux permease
VGAGVLGAALGPAAGGILTEVLGWESIFLAQVPLALVPLVALRGLDPRPEPAQAGRPRLRDHAALLLLSGGLVAALFLIVLLLVEGWGMSPATAGLVVTVMPLGAIAAARLGPRFVPDARIRTICGIVLAAGGLAALALLPRAGWGWTIAPQLLVAAGVGLALVALTERALADRPDTTVQGGWTIASRHAGVVLGLLLLAPILTDALDRNREEAVRAGAAVVLDSRIPALEKLRVAQDVIDEVDAADRRGELPSVDAVFEDQKDDERYSSLAAALQDQLDRAVTDAFSTPFFLAAALALAALVPVSIGRWGAR